MKQKDSENISKEKDHADRKTNELQSEVERLGTLLGSMKRKSKEDSEKFTELDQRKSKEIAAINKQCEDANKKIRQLENLNENMRKKLDRKAEEIASVSKKLKDTTATMNVGQKSP